MNKSEKSQIGKMSGNCVLPRQIPSGVWVFLLIT